MFIVLFGGNSFEHEISIVSAISLCKELKQEAHFVFLEPSGNLYLVEQKDMKSSHFSAGDYKKGAKVEFANGGFRKMGLFSRAIIKGIVINLIHGKSGEDGQIAAILDFYNIKYIGPRLEASVLSFNKEFTKIYAKNRGVKVLDFVIIHRNDDIKSFKIPLPAIVKPVRLGSSIGIGIIKEADEIDYALDCAFEFDDTVIIEPFFDSIKEYNLAGCVVNDEFRFSNIEEVSKSAFLDFDKKYLDFSREKKIANAPISEALANKIKDSFKRIYWHCFEGALIRCDFFLKDDEIYLNEINPIPGSMAVYLFENLEGTLNALSLDLPKSEILNIEYKYISKIRAMKGK